MGASFAKLQQLITVARCGSFSRAAEELHISQPALSRSIAAIERAYGFPIFNRIGHGVEATEAGAQVLAQAGPLLQSMRVFDRNVGLLASGKAGMLRMGFPPLLASQLLADLARDFYAPNAGITLQISIRSGPALLELLKNDEIEFFLFADSQVDPGQEIEVEEVGAILPICVARGAHPLAGRIGLSTADLSAYPWASSVEPPAMSGFLNPARLICDNYHILRDAVVQTDLVCICTRPLVADDLSSGRLCELDVPGFLPAATMISVACLKGRIFSPLARTAIERVRALLAAAVDA